METLQRLARIAQGRDFLNTNEFARVIGRSGQTIRKNLCQDGHAYGIKPRRIASRLAWPIAEVAKLLDGGRHE